MDLSTATDFSHIFFEGWDEIGLANEESFAIAGTLLGKRWVTLFWKYVRISLALTLGLPLIWKGLVVPLP